jgi:putative ABC transport system permease protein
MAVFERTKEIGVLKAIGASKLDIFKLIWIETILICTLGGAGGSIIAVSGGNVVEYFVKKVLPYAPSGKLVVITPGLLLIAFCGAIVLGLVSGIYPGFRASSMRPIEAIRSGE